MSGSGGVVVDPDAFVNRRDWPDEDWQLVWFVDGLRHEKEFDEVWEAVEWAEHNLDWQTMVLRCG